LRNKRKDVEEYTNSLSTACASANCEGNMKRPHHKKKGERKESLKTKDRLIPKKTQSRQGAGARCLEEGAESDPPAASAERLRIIKKKKTNREGGKNKSAYLNLKSDWRGRKTAQNSKRDAASG